MNAARVMSSLWCLIDLKILRPVSGELRDMTMTSTSRFWGSALLSSRKAWMRGNAVPGLRGLSSCLNWYLR